MTTLMRAEIGEIPEAAARLSAPDVQEEFRAIAARWTERNPAAFVTIARGSSDHAATYLKYVIEILSGRPVASVGPSVVSRFGASPQGGAVQAIAISQSGRSQDLGAATKGFASGGAPVLVLTNAPDSPLAQVGTDVLHVRAGPEKAVAATKSYVNSVLAGLWVIGHWARDAELLKALAGLPARLQAQMSRPDAALADMLSTAGRAFVVGRGPVLGIAQEVALKMLEVCGVHASGYSSAEVWHGPAAVIGPDMPVIALSPSDDAAEKARALGATVVEIGPHDGSHPMLAGLEQLVVAYLALEQAARNRGRNPDAPPNLKKETVTL
ncbi:SIS domain-containing protein [Actibacterium mucosum]|uniref:SIS domain-containing protein n=1 Tax=Actibacterium mucosum TaxID=1087332 RepID=UPI000B04F393|nr:SIS domain-containing protein [Actibacterium mucosum]